MLAFVPVKRPMREAQRSLASCALVWIFLASSPSLGGIDVSTTTDDKTTKSNAMLIEPAELHELLNRRDLRVLDTRAKDDYAKGHVPGAVRVDVASWQELGKSKDGFRNAKAWAEKVSELGIERDSSVVVYGSALPDTARIWWTLKYLGVENVMLLDGGWNQWVQEKRPTDMTVPKTTPSRFVPQFDTDRLEEMDSLKKSLRSGKVKVVDARSGAEFSGQEIRGKRGGHIAGATHLEWKELLADDGRFKPPDELRKLFQQRGILPDDTAICY